MTCVNKSCNQASLKQNIKRRDIPTVNLIKDFQIHENVGILSGQCGVCYTIYYADHKCIIKSNEPNAEILLRSAKYIKLGTNLWADRVFCGTVLNGIYNFYSSASAFAEFWNHSSALMNKHDTVNFKISRKQVWQAFLHESIRVVSEALNYDITIKQNSSIDDLTEQAFSLLGEGGTIRSAKNHACEECTHEYKATSDVIFHSSPSAVIGSEPV